MSNEQFLQIIETLKPQPKTSREIWFERLRLASYIVSIVVGLLVYYEIREGNEQKEMMKAYFSASQSKSSELIGTLRGQNDQRTADILQILQDQQKKEFEKISHQSKGF